MGASQSMQLESLESIMEACQSHREDYTTEELQLLEQRLTGADVEQKCSAIQQRYFIIMEFFDCWLEWLEVPADNRVLESRYEQYIRAVKSIDQDDQFKEESASVTENVIGAYVTLDFWRAASILKANGGNEAHLQMLKSIEEAFRSGVMPTDLGPLPCFRQYGKEALRMVKIFRAIKNNGVDVCSFGEAEIVKAILIFLEQHGQYMSSREWDRRIFLENIKTHVLDLYAEGIRERYGFMSLRLYESFVTIDLRSLKRRLHRMRANKNDTQMVDIVGQYLIHAQLDPTFCTWLSENLPAQLDAEDEEAYLEESFSLDMDSNASSEDAFQDQDSARPVHRSEAPPAYKEELESFGNLPVQKLHVAVHEILHGVGVEHSSSQSTTDLAMVVNEKLQESQDQIKNIQGKQRLLLEAQALIQMIMGKSAR